MTIRLPGLRLFARGWVLAVLSATALSLWHPGERTQIGAGIEGRLLDLRFQIRGPLPSPETVAIVVFDDLAVAALQAFPPRRADIAEAVRGIFAGGAEVVALDLLLVDARQDDPVLAAAMEQGPSVLGVAEAPNGADPMPLASPGGFGLIIGRDPLEPLPALGPNAGLQGHAALGHVTVQHDADGALRRMRPALTLRTPKGMRTLPGLAIAAVSVRGRRPDIVLPDGGAVGRVRGDWPTAWLDLRGMLPLDFHGPSRTIETYSAAALSEADLDGKIVFLGATATGFGDRHATSLDATLPGVEAHATLAANLLDGRTLRRDMAAWGVDAALAAAVALASFGAGGLGRPWFIVASGIAVAAATLVALQAAFVGGWWLDATTVLAALFTGLAIGGAQRFLDTRRRASNLGRFQSPRLVEAIASQTHPMGNRVPHEAVVIFVDIVGFTTLAEDMGPAEAAQFLRGFHEMVEAAADPKGGTIMDFAGDGVLVVFGVPEAAEDDARRALRFIDRLFQDAADRGIALRAGGHVGLVQLGLLGGLRHRTVSISGDVVNTASRLQDAAKRLDAALVVSEALVYAGGDEAEHGLAPAGEIALRGRSAPILAWIRPMGTHAGRQQ